jgi:hypothetical protein
MMENFNHTKSPAAFKHRKNAGKLEKKVKDVSIFEDREVKRIRSMK